ncbi:hypothetical protein [Sessilibacter corallicola]|uniref:hypothetical protein n=1 Tax=Sessilibacter corallicola TaxID=2904075 RepID=UPI001E310B6C|nr:hypothetical protein [Sessilibacter corallicola]MCE2027800.1 hypothetical protein [Sessilibacter corallicola]
MTAQRPAGITKPAVRAICLILLFLLSKLVCAHHLVSHTDVDAAEEHTCELCVYASCAAALPAPPPEFMPPTALSDSPLFSNHCTNKNSSEFAAIRAPPANFSS